MRVEAVIYVGVTGDASVMLSHGFKGWRRVWKEEAKERETLGRETQRTKPTHSGAARVRAGVQLNYHCGPEKAG